MLCCTFIHLLPSINDNSPQDLTRIHSGPLPTRTDEHTLTHLFLFGASVGAKFHFCHRLALRGFSSASFGQLFWSLEGHQVSYQCYSNYSSSNLLTSITIAWLFFRVMLTEANLFTQQIHYRCSHSAHNHHVGEFRRAFFRIASGIETST